jgi:hypothetical protein
VFQYNRKLSAKHAVFFISKQVLHTLTAFFAGLSTLVSHLQYILGTNSVNQYTGEYTAEFRMLINPYERLVRKLERKKQDEGPEQVGM